MKALIPTDEDREEKDWWDRARACYEAYAKAQGIVSERLPAWDALRVKTRKVWRAVADAAK